MKSFTSVKRKAFWTEKRGVVATKRTRKSNVVFRESHSSTTACNPVKQRVCPPPPLINKKHTLTPHQIKIYHAQFVNINTFLPFCDTMTLYSCSESTPRLTNI